MKRTISALAALALVATANALAYETEPGNTVRLAGSKDVKVTLV
jgi:predicted small secreted protein